MRNGRRLRILVVSPTFPCPPSSGFAMRVFQLTDWLARHHDVTVVSYVGPDDPPSDQARYADGPLRLVTVLSPKGEAHRKRFKQASSLVSRTPFHAGQLRSSAMQAAVDEVLGEARFDLVLLSSSQLGWLHIDGAPVVVDEHNIESELLGRMATTEASWLRRSYNRWEHVRYRAFEQRVWNRVAGCSTTSRRDADAVRARCPDLPVTVVPNGVDPEQFRSAGEPPPPGGVVFTGLLHYRPNVDGIQWFLDEVWPLVRQARPQTRLTIVGDGPAGLLESLRGAGVTVTGRVPEIPPYLDAAAVVVVPLRMGGGTRLKVVEAMSMGRAIVSTTLGSEGLDVVSGTHLELVDEPSGFAAAVISLLDDPETARRLGAASRELVEQRYSWARSAARLDELLRLVARSGDVELPGAAGEASGGVPT